MKTSFLQKSNNNLSSDDEPGQEDPDQIQAGFPVKQGLYDPQFEHDSCGVGFVCNIKGKKSNKIIKQGLEALLRLSHRGAVGADPKTGDGAGLLIQIPHKFLVKETARSGISLPDAGEYGTGLVFLPVENNERDFCVRTLETFIQQEGQELLGWRDVPVDNSMLGFTARDTEPVIQQVFIGSGKRFKDQLCFERKLYLIRKQTENAIRGSGLKQKNFFYITNLSSRTLSYKGLLTPSQLGGYFLDLREKDISSAICLVHSRYSTNTFPAWDLAQPFRFLAHNGEINTLRGNINWMRARERLLKSEVFGPDIKKIKPVIVPHGSDSAALDNVFELLTLSGRSLPHAMMMLIPRAWENNNLLNKRCRDFYQYHACLTEPWDGPAAIAFTDGKVIGAALDRNGLRPARYIITKDDTIIMASEAGVLDIPAENIVVSGRLEPGKILFIDTEAGRIIDDDQVKNEMAGRRPYGKWLMENMVDLDKLPRPKPLGSKIPKKEKQEKIHLYAEKLIVYLKAFGYTREDLNAIIQPMAEQGVEPVGSMGNDTPHAVLSEQPQLLYNYFKQLFAQVTNPAIDPIREESIMSLESYIGPSGGLLDETPAHCHKLRVKHPVLTNEELAGIIHIQKNRFKTKTISILFEKDKKSSFKKGLNRICREAVSAIREGYTFIVLSDRDVNKKYAPLPALLAAGALHQYLVKKSLRTQIGIIIETAEAREVHHFALLFGYGADCINPYLAYEVVEHLVKEKNIDLSVKKALSNYIKALEKGIKKILSKMGISTLHSYRGAQIFEALGLGREVIDAAFTGTPSRIGGLGLDMIARETIIRHNNAYENKELLIKPGLSFLDAGGVYQWRKDGEFHLWNPGTIAALQDAVRQGSYEEYKRFASLINNQSQRLGTLRGMLSFCLKGNNAKPVPLETVEPVSGIVKRFVIGAMSFGSISKEAHETLAIAMNRLGGRSNTGEGGEDPDRFGLLPGGCSKRSAVKQVASGRFGVTPNYLINADELQIKIAQGAKPGEGGQLPGYKVSDIIARTRHTTPGVTLISPPPHHDIYSIEDLAQLIFDLKNVNPRARISVKLVSEAGVGTVAAGVVKARADMILISGGDGGTGASPLSSIRHAGLPWELGLSETHQTLVLNGLRSRVRLQTDGQIRTGKDAAVAALLGAEEYGFCTAALITMGCVMLRHCNLDNCSVGIASQDKILRKRFSGKPEYVENYLRFVAEELREIMASLGIRKIDDMVGRTELLEKDQDILNPKAKTIDFSKILYKPDVPDGSGRYCQTSQNHSIGSVLDLKLIRFSDSALKTGRPVSFNIDIKNNNRAAGAMLSGEVCRRYGRISLDDDTIQVKFRGTAGQSFAAFLAHGITFELEGMANDYAGKSMAGGKIIIYPDLRSGYSPEDNVIIGNTAFYGATSGEAYIRGKAGERFCIRNSGLYAVVEGVGDHGCEYMTGGRVIILGRTGRNFGAGMSGGIAYVYNKDNKFKQKCNPEMVELEVITGRDSALIRTMLSDHYKYTKSISALKVLDNFNKNIRNFIKVMPLEYKRVLGNK